MDHLSRMAQQARKRGMSYGQYMGMRFEKNGYKPTPKEEPILEVAEVGEGSKVCLICGRPFLKNSRGNQAKTCSEKCSKALYRKYAREKYREEHKNDPVQTAHCVICGKEFPKKHSRMICCSPECNIERRKWRVARYKEVNNG